MPHEQRKVGASARAFRGSEQSPTGNGSCHCGRATSPSEFLPLGARSSEAVGQPTAKRGRQCNGPHPHHGMPKRGSGLGWASIRAVGPSQWTFASGRRQWHQKANNAREPVVRRTSVPLPGRARTGHQRPPRKRTSAQPEAATAASPSDPDVAVGGLQWPDTEQRIRDNTGVKQTLAARLLPTLLES